LKDFRETVVELGDYWDSFIGLAFFYIVIITAYYTGLLSILKDDFSEYRITLNYIIPLIIIILITAIWAFKSNRINLYKKRKITNGLFLQCNDFKSQVKIRKILLEMISEVENEFEDIKLKLFPINYITSEKDLEKYILANDHVIDNAFFAKVHNGNCIEESQSIEKIEIQNLLFSGRFDVNTKGIISQDINLRNMNKNWEYIESQSFKDKTKIKHNLKDSVLFFIGLYLVYMKELDLSLQVFKYLKKSEEECDENDKINKAKKNRLNEILLNLYSFNAFRKYIDDKDLNTAFELLKECEVIFHNNHAFSFNNNITLARIYYEKGEIDNAHLYTNKAALIKKDNAAIYCNLGFFGIIENNIEKVYTNYKELGHTYKFKKHLNYIDVIYFLELYRPKYPASEILFEFAIATLNLFYGDKKMGQIRLISLQAQISDNAQYIKIFKLSEHFTTKGSFKSPYYHRDKKIKKIKDNL
jgi:hypothetical protein